MARGVSSIPAGAVLALAFLALMHTPVFASDVAVPDNGCTATLTEVAALPTEGNSGFEAWVEGEDIRLIAANLWDGINPLMESGSWIYNVSGDKDGVLTVNKLQRIPTTGATQAKYIPGPNGRDMLMINNYMKCGGKEEATARERPPCGPTSVYVPDGPGWADYKSLRTVGPTKSEYIYVGGGALWISVVENFMDQVSLWQFQRQDNNFDRRASMRVHAASDAVPTLVDDTLYFTVASKQSEKGSNNSACVLFALVDGSLMQVGALPAFGTSDLETIKFKGEDWLFVANERTEATVMINSHVYKFDKTGWAAFQDIPTTGARGGHFFIVGEDLWLGVANFGDMKHGKVESKSSLWRLNKEDQKFERMVEVDSFGATNWRHFTIKGHHFLALANQGHLTAKKYQTSYIYRLDTTCGGGDGSTPTRAQPMEEPLPPVPPAPEALPETPKSEL
eukprot:CAMPEP_0173414620 /NCGR_PEP_ID=MMETSP1356-20130122/84423_1 /TAXON_ID=77927 ORGANISM="Hemiselmis virescens, Strain PCC157" /NCGR_SAMPLE_ID=MMETSP1356 /ASSEMBLY_ACC=CAM_ASM_000847 /LENGTH=449 /DNA_ID=CAMNT_0014376813 /DNA_START=18 /DNA_END=1367 /DNA_ORIENTATION=-